MVTTGATFPDALKYPFAMKLAAVSLVARTERIRLLRIAS